MTDKNGLYIVILCVTVSAKKPRSQEAKKPRSQEAKKPRSQEAKKPRNYNLRLDFVKPLGTALIQIIINEYQKAKTEKNINRRIFRGTSRTISSTAEDFFAKYLDKLLADYEVTIWVDPQIVCDVKKISTTGKTKSFLFRPDICVLNSKNEVCLIFELKMDFGRNEDLAENALQRKKDLALITQKGTAHARINGREEQITLPKSLVLNYVIFADNNLPIAKRTAIKNNFIKNKAGKMYVLTSGDYLSNAKGKHEINTADFDLLETMALKIISSKRK